MLPLASRAFKIMGVFERVLGHPVHPSDDFFEVGGHSVLATMMTFALRQELRQEFPLNLLYQCRSVEQLSIVLQQSIDDPSLDVGDVVESTSSDKVAVTDLATETALDASITPNGRPVASKVGCRAAQSPATSWLDLAPLARAGGERVFLAGPTFTSRSSACTWARVRRKKDCVSCWPH